MIRSMLPLVLCFALSTSFGQNRTTPYEFPVKPGTEEWKKLKTGEEMLAACTIPEKVLASLTTEALARTCLSYPLLHEVTYASNLQQGIIAVIRNFNGLTELLARKDGAAALMELYSGLNPLNLDMKQSEEQQGAFTFKFTYLELLLARPGALLSLSTEQRSMLMKMAVSKYDGKVEKISVFGTFGLNTSALLMASIMNADNRIAELKSKAGNDEIDIFLAMAATSNPKTISLVYETARAY